MVTRERLASRWRMMPSGDISSVDLYAYFPTGDSSHPYNALKPYTVQAVIKRSISRNQESIFADVKGATRKRSFHLFTETISASWLTSFDPWALEVLPRWLVKESNGAEWIIVSADNRQRGTEWWCPAYRYEGAAIIV